MRIPGSDMPESWRWEEFFNPPAILDLLGCTGHQGDVVDFGCGYGTFTFPAAKRTINTVHAFDIDPAMVSCVSHRAAVGSILNIQASVRDLEESGTGLVDGSMGHAMLFNVLYSGDHMKLLREAHRVLKEGGTLSILNWRTDIETPCGPSIANRPTPGQCFGWADRAGFHSRQLIELGNAAPWHYGQLLLKSPLI